MVKYVIKDLSGNYYTERTWGDRWTPHLHMARFWERKGFAENKRDKLENPPIWRGDKRKAGLKVVGVEFTLEELDG